jgi:hypothetical protein
MERVRKICPQCGAANPMEADRCVECGATMRGSLPILRESKLPVPWKEVGASLALGAAALAMRAGWRLLQALLERRDVEPVSLRTASSAVSSLGAWRPRRGERPKRGEIQEAFPSEPQMRMWGRRVSGVRCGDGISHWEVEEFVWERQP